jgi:hypothetical protein
MADTSLWATRRQAEAALADELKPFADLLNEAFAAIDTSIARLETLGYPFGQVCALVLIKARNLALGCYSLSLDGVAQEAGALFRLLVESLEVLMYFRSDRSRINEVLEGRLPKAGDIAKKIEGKFQGLREHLNEHASHLSLSADAMVHLIDLKTGRLKPVQGHHVSVLQRNLSALLGIMAWLAIEGGNCTTVGSDAFDQETGDAVEHLKNRIVLLVSSDREGGSDGSTR